MAAIIVALGAMVLIGHLFGAIFRKTLIPDVLLLTLAGILMGPAGLAWVSADDFGRFGPPLTTVALLVILFEGGLRLELDTLRKSLPSAAIIMLTTFAVSAAMVTLIVLPIVENMPLALAIGATLAGTSSAVVVPTIEALKLGKRPYTILFMESALTDVLCIIFAVAFLAAVSQGEVSSLQIGAQILVSFGAASLIGIVGAIVWAALFSRLRALPNPQFMTIAAVFLLYGLTEYLGHSGPIMALAFGITAGNVRPGRISLLDEIKFGDGQFLGVTEGEKSFYSELVFLLKVFFFCYLGMSIQFGNPGAWGVGLLIVAAVYLARLVLTRLLLTRRIGARGATLISVMIPKGLAAAVLASLPLQMGLPNGEFARDVAYAVVLLSIVATSLLVPVAEKTPVRFSMQGCFAASGKASLKTKALRSVVWRKQTLNSPWQKSEAAACSRARLSRINMLLSRDREGRGGEGLTRACALGNFPRDLDLPELPFFFNGRVTLYCSGCSYFQETGFFGAPQSSGKACPAA